MCIIIILLCILCYYNMHNTSILCVHSYSIIMRYYYNSIIMHTICMNIMLVYVCIGMCECACLCSLC